VVHGLSPTLRNVLGANGPGVRPARSPLLGCLEPEPVDRAAVGVVEWRAGEPGGAGDAGREPEPVGSCAVGRGDLARLRPAPGQGVAGRLDPIGGAVEVDGRPGEGGGLDQVGAPITAVPPVSATDSPKVSPCWLVSKTKPLPSRAVSLARLTHRPPAWTKVYAAPRNSPSCGSNAQHPGAPTRAVRPRSATEHPNRLPPWLSGGASSARWANPLPVSAKT